MEKSPRTFVGVRSANTTVLLLNSLVTGNLSHQRGHFVQRIYNLESPIIIRYIIRLIIR